MQVRWASGLNVLAGIWLVISPWILSFSGATGALWNDVIVGAVVVVLAGIRFLGAFREAWLSWVNVAVGVWLFIAGFWLAGGDAAATWNDLILGVIVVILAWWSSMESTRTTT